MQIRIDNHLTVIDCPFTDELQTRLSFQNPKWLENNRMNRWQGDTPKLLRCYEDTAEGMIIPRGFCRQLINLARKNGETFTIDDKRRTLPPVQFEFDATLRGYQQEAVDAMLQKDFGTLSAPTGSGKTVMALAIIAEREQPALIVVHTRELADQWVSRIGAFLGIPADDVGIIGGGKCKIGEKVTVALVQSLYKRANDVAPHTGHLIVDECHRCPSRTFVEAVSAFDSRYMLGLTATPWRRDKLSRLIFWHLGDVLHTIDKAALANAGHLVPAEVITRETNFNTILDPTLEYSKMLSHLTMDPQRNALIARDVALQAENGGGVCLVLSDRKLHCEALQNALKGFGISSVLLTGDVPAKRRSEVVKDLNAGRVKVVVATGQLIGEGFDCKALSTLFLATPIKFSGRVIQYLGRVLRPAPGKDKAVIYDYVDSRVGVLVASSKARRQIYNALN